MNPLQELLDFVAELDKRRIFRRIDSFRDAILVEVHVPGECWEVEFFADGSVEVEMFESTDGVRGEEEAREALRQLLARQDDAEEVDRS